MKKYIAAVLILLTALTLIPATAFASTISGWTSKIDYSNTNPNKYAIEIDVTNQIITVYSSYIGGNIVLQSLCTTGSEKTPTGTGTFKLGNLKERFGYFVAYGEYAQYWSQITRGIYIHSLMYAKQNTSSMSKSAYKNLGKNVSHGCVRVLPDIAQWIFYNCPPGTVCKVVKKAADAQLVKQIKAGIPSFSSYVQPNDSKKWPQEIPGVINRDKTPFRTGSSSVNDKTLCNLPHGEKVVLVQISNDWCKVRRQNGDTGYVKSQYILAYPDRKVETRTATVTTKKTYIYSKRSTDSSKLVTIPKGSEITLLEKVTDKWYKASYNGHEGYIYKYIKDVTDYVYPTLTSASSPAQASAGSTFSIGGSGSSAPNTSQASDYTNPPNAGSSSSGMFRIN